MSKNWKHVLNAAAVILAITAFVVTLTTSAKLGILMLIGSIFTGCIANDIFPSVSKWLSIALWVLMLPFLFVGSATSGTKVKWQFETSNAALPRPKKTDKEKEDSEWKEVLSSLRVIARSIDKNTDAQDKLREELVEGQKNLTEEVRRSTALAEEARDAAKAAKEKLDGMAVPERTFVPPEDVPWKSPPMKVPRTYLPPAPVEPVPETSPEPKGEILPNLIPKPPLPELRVKITPQAGATHLKCNCGKVHEIQRNGESFAWYSCCTDDLGKALCQPESFGTKRQK